MSATPKDTQPPVTQERLLEVIAKSNLSTLTNGCYGEICTQRTAYSIIESLKNNPPQLTGMEKTKLRALGAWDAIKGAADSAGKSYGVTGTPESRAAWAVETSEAAVKGIATFFSDPQGAAEKFGAKAASDNPKDIREVSASVSSLLLSIAAAKGASSITKGPKVKPPADAPSAHLDSKPNSKSDGFFVSFRGKIKYRTAADANKEMVDRGRAKKDSVPFKDETMVAERDILPGEKFKMSVDEAQYKKLMDPNNPEGVGGWGTRDTFTSQADALNKMAIDPSWKPNGIPITVEFEVIKPFRVLDGVAGPQGSLTGGAQQFFLDLPRNGGKEYVRVVGADRLPK
jgi:hypothetical protein